MSQMVKNPPALLDTQEMQVLSLGGEDPPGEGNDNSLQYSCLENPMHRKAWWATIHGPQSLTQLSDQHTHTHRHMFHIIVRDQSLTALLPHVCMLSAVFEGTEERG